MNMNSDKALEVIEQILPFRPLNSIERFVLRQSWHGQTYNEMAQTCNYGSIYIKEIGSQLWQDLSKVLGKRVTKKNLHLVINDYRQNHTNQQRSEPEHKFSTDRYTENQILDSGASPEIEFPGGPLPLKSPLYINRPPIEELAYSEINQPGSMIQIKAPRQMGKSSFLNRVIAHAKAQGYETVYLELQEVDRAVFASLHKFLRWLCINLSRQLNLNPQLEEYWDLEMGSKASCKFYFEGYLLEQVRHPILLAVNEVNRVSRHPNIAQDFLPMLQYWHELAKQVEVWQKIRLVLVHSADIDVPLGFTQSPFSVGLSIRLPLFTSEQIQDLAQRYGLDWARGEEGAKQLLPLVEMVGGHPYLVNVALYHLYRRATTLEELLQFAPTQTGIYGDHLRNLLVLLRENAELASALRQVVMTKDTVQLEAITAHKLESLGLIQLHSNEASPSCELYRLYFREQLGGKHQFASHFLEPDSRERNCHQLGTFGVGSTDINKKHHLAQFANRHCFNTYLEVNWQQWIIDMTVISLILCDVDYFKFYRKAYGQIIGDVSIEKITNVVHNCVRHQAIMTARCGETKFAALLLHTDACHAAEIAELIREQVKALGLTHDHSKFGGFPSQFVTVSVGVVSTTLDPNSSPATLIATAEEALSKAKRGGRDRVVSSQGLEKVCK